MNEHWKNWIGWSNVRQVMWDRCPRAFYNRYVARWDGDRRGKKILRLSNLRTLNEHGSVFVMDVVGTQLHHALLGRGTDQAMATEALDGKFDYLAKHPNRLVETTNGTPVDAEAFRYEKARAQLLLSNFYNKVWPGMAEAVPLEHGRILSYDVDGHRVWLNVDAAFKDGKGVVVTHITSGGNGYNGGGASGGKNRSMKITGKKGAGKKGAGKKTTVPDDPAFPNIVRSRALWAMKVYRLPHDRVKVEYLNLEKPGLPRFTTVDPLDLKRFKEHVVEMCQMWEAITSEKDAPTAPEKRKCMACPYATECPDGKVLLKEVQADREQEIPVASA